MAGHRRGRCRFCVYCGSRGDITVDHVIPLSRWREFRIKRRVLDNSSNRVDCCLKCNREKSNQAPVDWFSLHPEYFKRFTDEARYLSDAVKYACGIRN